MKKKILFIITLIIGILITYFIYSNIDLFSFLKYLLMVLSFKLIPYFFVTFLINVLLTYKWDLILRAMSYKVPIHNLFFYRIIGNAISYITPSAHIGGEPARAALLKRHNIDFSKGLSTIIIDKSIELIFNIFFGIIGMIILIFSYTVPLNSILIIYSLVLILAFILFFYYRIIKGLGFFTPILQKLNFKYKYIMKVYEFERNTSYFFKFHKNVFYKILIISFLWWVLMFLEYALLLNLFNIKINFINVFLVIAGVGVAYAMPLPAALGVLEAFQISVFKFIKLNSAYAVVVSIVIRLKDVLWTIIGLLLLSYYGVKIKILNGNK